MTHRGYGRNPKPPKPPKPVKDDSAWSGLWIILLLIAALVLGGLLIWVNVKNG